MAVITFSINASQVQVLQGFKQGQESDNLTAKRILLNAIGQSPASTSHDQIELEDIRERLETIEETFDLAIKAEHLAEAVPDNTPELLGKLMERIQAIEDRLTAIESHGSAPVFPGDQPITDHGQWVICLTIDDKPVKYWTGSEWSEEISIANRYQSETSLKRTLDKLKTRKRDDPTAVIRYNTIANLERILKDRFQEDEGAARI